LHYLIGCLLLLSTLGCRHKEAPPSEETYKAAAIPHLVRTKRNVKRVRVSPAKTPLLKKAAAKIAPPRDLFAEKVNGAMGVMLRPAVHAVCRPYQGSIQSVGDSVAQLSDVLRAGSHRANDSAGIMLVHVKGSKWKLCMALLEPGKGSLELPAQRVARIWHHGSYVQTLERRPELESWFKKQAQVLAGELRVTLYRDPEQFPAAKLLSSLDLSVGN